MTTILCSRGDELETIKEEKVEWVFKVLKALGLDEEILRHNLDEKDDIERYLQVNEIEIVDNLDNGELDIFRKRKLVGQWKQPRLILHKEKSNNWYYEIKLNEWALPFQTSRRNK